MKRLDPAVWQVISPLFDRALDLEPAARRAFLDELRSHDAPAGEILARLLASHERLLRSPFLDTPALADIEPDLAGSTIGAYTLDAPLGAGGTGVVWKAHRSDGRYEGAVALKLLQLAVLERHAEATFTLEGTLLARLSHPNIARLLDAGVTGAGQPYLVLEYVEGTRLDAFAEAERLDVPARLALLLQVADAVAHAHAHLIVHRDLKPSNVLVDRDGRVKLLDFGIASWLDHEAGRAAPAGARRFTPDYAAPEQMQGGPITTATDVYALGVLAHVLLTGRHPFNAAPDAPAGRRLDTDLALVVATAMQTEPAARFGSAAAFADELRRYLAHEPIAARGGALPYVVGRFVRRNRVAVVLAAGVVAAVAAGTAGVWVQSRRATAERDFALGQLARAEAVSDMNAFLMSDAAPHGRPFTAGDLLTRAEALVNRQPTEPLDPITVESLVSIGTQFQSQDEDANARRVLTRAFELAARLPAPAVGTRAEAGCALANTLARGDATDLARAQTLVAESLALLPDTRALALDRAFCLRMAGSVARLAGDSDADLAHTLEARRVLQASGLGSDLARVSIDMDIAEAYRSAGRHVEAAAAFQTAFTALAQMGRDRTERAGTLLNNWGLSLQFLGRPRDADRAFQQALAISRADGGDASVSPMLLLNAQRPALELGRAAEALAGVERAIAEARRLDDKVVVLQATLLAVTCRRQLGDLDGAAGALDEAERLMQAQLPPGHTAFGAIALQRAQMALARGEFAAARAHALDVQRLAGTGPQSSEARLQAQYRLALIGLEEGRADDAVAAATRALEMEAAKVGAGGQSSGLGRLHVVLGRARQAAGRIEEARAALTAGVAGLDATLGADHAETRAARALLAALR